MAENVNKLAYNHGMFVNNSVNIATIAFAWIIQTIIMYKERILTPERGRKDNIKAGFSSSFVIINHTIINQENAG